MDRDTSVVLSMEAHTVPDDKPQTDISRNINKMRGSNECEGIGTSEISLTVAVDVLHENQHSNEPTRHGQETFEHTAMDLRCSTLNVTSSSSRSDTTPETTTFNNISSGAASSSSSQDQPEVLRHTSIPLSNSERGPYLTHPRSSSSSVTASPSPLNTDPSATMSRVNASALDVPSPAPTSLNRSQGTDETLPLYLLYPRVVDILNADLGYVPPPQYTAEPHFYDANGRTRPPATVSEQLRYAPREMPPSYDETVEADRAYIVRDAPHQRPVVYNTSQLDQEMRCCSGCVCGCCWMVIIILGTVAMLVFVT